MTVTGYSREVYEDAQQVLRQRRRNAEEAAKRNQDIFHLRFPQARELERRLSATALKAARAVLAGENARESLLRLKEENRSLQEKLGEMLKEAGLPQDALEPRYECPACGDTGFVDGRMCSCMKSLLRERAYARLNALTPLSLSTFESFTLDYYPEKTVSDSGRSPREAMREILLNCRKYAETFSLSSQSLLMQGSTGLGKTHLSLAIANEVIAKGFGVIYCSVSSILSKLEAEHFGREENGDTEELLQSCDLLILDDLGTEFKSSFFASTAYAIINARLLTQKPTIISTNLSMRELQDRYSDRFASRVAGNYVRFLFTGHDNRVQKLLFRRNRGNE